MFERITKVKKSFLYETTDMYMWAVVAPRNTDYAKRLARTTLHTMKRSACEDAMDWLWFTRLCGSVFELFSRKNREVFPNGIERFCV